MEHTKYKNINHYQFEDEIKSVIICGDIHGEFNEIINKICIQYDIHDSVIIIAGDCGFGFNKCGYYENIYNRNKKRLEEFNNYIVGVRGNHDNPEYFNETNIKFERFMTVPDYSVIEAAGHSVLCIGGATSIDRQDRIDKEMQEFMKGQSYKLGREPNNPLSPCYYWKDEAPKYCPELLEEVYERCVIDAVVTHTCPSFCEKINKDGLEYWCNHDSRDLMSDVQQEREVMDKIYENLVEHKQPISSWTYGHFHQSWHSRINGIRFDMLDINELKELY